MERLKHDAHIAAAETCERVFVEFGEIFAGDHDGAGIGAFEPAMTMSKVDLPEPDGPTRPIASPRPI